MPNRFLSRRSFLNTSLKSAAAVRLTSSVNIFSQRNELLKPNIIFILADDLGYGDPGCYGQQRIKTPSIDRLSAEGIRFTNCYSGSTVCAPSRCCLMTGRHTGHARIRGNKLVPLLPGDLTVAEILKNTGYTTGIIGKWGLGEAETTGIPNKKGFDEWFGYLNQRHAHNYYPELLWKNKEMCFLNKGEYSPDLFAREAINFIRANKSNPFFLYLACTIPHANNELGNLTKNGLEVPDDAPYSNETWPQVEKNFAAMITRMDRDIGALMALLRELNIDENTIVFFTSDNGPHKEGGHDDTYFQSSGPLRGFKRDLYEGGIRVPMIVRWKDRVKTGAVSDQAWAFWDFLPTVCEIAGTSIPQGIDGISMLPAILGGKQTNHEYLYWEFHERGFQQAIRMGDWKAIRQGINKPIELYNLPADIGEKNNIAAEQPDVVKEVEQMLRIVRTESDDWPVKAGQ